MGRVRSSWVIFGLFLLSFSLPLNSWGVQAYEPVCPDPVLEMWRWRSFSELKGLGVRCMTEAADGSIWFGIDNGVIRYDGLNWTTYTEKNGILNPPVNALCASHNGDIYAGTEWGISRFRDGVWTHMFPRGADLPWPIDKIIQVSDGSIWAATGWGAVHLTDDGETLFTTDPVAVFLSERAPWLTTVVVPSHATPVLPWGSGLGLWGSWGGFLGISRGTAPAVIWAIAPGSPAERTGLRVGDFIWSKPTGAPEGIQSRTFLPASRIVYLDVKQGNSPTQEICFISEALSGSVPNFQVFDVFQDKEGVLWFGLQHGEIVQYDPQVEGDDAWKLHSEKNGLRANRSPRIMQDDDGIIWVISDHDQGGVNRFDGRSWSFFSLADQGGNDDNTSIIQTSDGKIWISGFELHILHNGRWSSYSQGGSSGAPVPFHRMRLLEASDGAVWIAGLGQGVVRFDHTPSRWQTYEGLAFGCQSPDGTIWFTSSDGTVVCNRDGRWIRYDESDGLIRARRDVLLARDGTVWVTGTQGGTGAIARFKPSVGRWESYPHDGISFLPRPHGMIEATDGSVWFGCREGVLKFDGQEWRFYGPPQVPSPTYAIAQTGDGKLWFGGDGLSSFNGRIWQHIEQPKELNSWIHCMTRTKDGNLWVGTRTYGIFRFDGKNWTQYTVRDGLKDNNIRQILQTPDGSIWANTQEGICRFDGIKWSDAMLPPELLPVYAGYPRHDRTGGIWFLVSGFLSVRIVPDTEPPETRITINIDRISHPGNTTIAWNGTDPWRITIEEKLLYSWRLDDGHWSPFSPETSRVFLGLTDGKHRFEVRARDRFFNIDPTPARVDFVVVPPLWKRPWFILSTFLLFTIMVVQTARVIRRGKALAEMNAELECRVEKRTAQLSRSNRNLRMLSESNQALVRASNEEELTREICKILVENGQYRMALVGLLDEEAKDRFRLINHWGHGEPNTEILVHLANAVTQTRKPIVVNDIRNAPDYLNWSDEAEQFGYRSCIGLPLTIGEKCIGVLIIYAAEEDRFDHAEAHLLEELADDLAYGIGTLRERIARIKAEEALRKSEENYRLLAETTRDIILLHDMEGRILYVNQAGLDFAGFDRQSAIGKSIMDFLPPEVLPELAERRSRRTMGNGSTLIYEVEFINRDGERVPVEVSSTPVLRGGQIESILVVARDITERKQAELEREKLQAQLLQAQKMEAIGRLAGGVAHDFNNMLSVIIGYGDILLHQVSKTDSIYPFIEQIVDAGRRSAMLTRQLLAFSRRQTMRPEVLNLNNVIVNLEKMLRRLIGEDIELILRLDNNLTPIMVDPSQIEQIIMNLIVNARDAMPKGGKLIISTSNVTLNEQQAQFYSSILPGEYVSMTVTDTGVGIDEKTLPHIFEPFFTTKEEGKGTGLGLSTVYGIVKQSGGDIRVESTPGQGTTFEVLLPQVQSQKKTEKDQNDLVEPHNGKGQILVVEDEASVRKLVIDSLSRLGYDMIEATNAQEALNLVKQEGLHPDLVIADVVMPGMDGFELISHLVEIIPNINVLYMSGYVDKAIVRQGIIDSDLPIIYKPFDVRDLAAKVQSLICQE